MDSNNNRNRVSFGDTNQPVQNFISQKKTPLIAVLIINLSGGLIKDERQANIVILVLVAFFVLGSWILYSSSTIDIQDPSSKSTNSYKQISTMGRPDNN